MSDSKIKVFLGLPNLLTQHWGIPRQLFHYATKQDYQIQLAWSTERRHHDYSRNELVKEFLGTTCDYMMMVDADVEPNPNFLELTKHEKPVIAATVFCWIKDKLLPSVWQRAKCEQCMCVEIWEKEGKIHDVSQYVGDGPWLLRWNPFRNVYQRFYSRETHKFKDELKCRCQGTGLDPWVFRVAENIADPTPPIKVDSVGTAAICIRRDVLEKVPWPPFEFLYRPDKSILCTEDHIFCWKAATCGFEIWADQTMPSSHYKTLDLLGVHNWGQEIYKSAFEEALNAARAEKETPAVVVPKEEEIARFARN